MTRPKVLIPNKHTNEYPIKLYYQTADIGSLDTAPEQYIHPMYYLVGNRGIKYLAKYYFPSASGYTGPGSS